MKTVLKAAIFPVIIALFPISGSLAQTGDAESGVEKSALCVACHGTDGNSVNPLFPKLAGQIPGYIDHMLQEFKSGAIPGPTMSAITAALSESDTQDLDAYFANQSMTFSTLSDEQAESVKEGESIFTAGLPDAGVPACNSCHGALGEGIPPHTGPRIGGQHAAYIESQLLAYKSENRPSEDMAVIAAELSEEQISTLALYISSLDSSKIKHK